MGWGAYWCCKARRYRYHQGNAESYRVDTQRNSCLVSYWIEDGSSSGIADKFCDECANKADADKCYESVCAAD